jgi:hypothetical protein
MKKIGQIERWEDTQESNSYKGEQAWYDRVKSKITGEFHQVDELRREWVPADWKPPHQDTKGEPIKYPLKHVSEIIRKRLADGSEWVITRQQH